ncbi:MAG: glutathione peroxidase [Gemmatimonadaceae bacterium]|nr:glutathione peroxidase [Acetobacteraceae bacterium]
MAPVPPTAWTFEFPSIDEGRLRFEDFRGQVLLVVNTASFCSFTPQYKQLGAVHQRLSGRGFSVIGVPSQDFGQESDSNSEVKAFCELTYGVDFPMTAIGHVRGAKAAPFYKWVREVRRWEPTWNFSKVLIGRDGMIAGTFSPNEEPERGKLAAAIEAAVART